MAQPSDIGDLGCLPGGLLAIDPSKTMLGFCYVDPRALQAWPEVPIGKVGPVDGVIYGARSFAEWPYDQFIFRLSRWLHDMLDRWKPGRLVAEEPVHRPTMKGGIPADSHARAQVMYGAKAIVTVHAMIRGIRPEFIEHQTAKLHFCGGGKVVKADVVATAERRGWRPQDHNVADALAIADTAIALERSKLHAAGMQRRVDAALERQATAG